MLVAAPLTAQISLEPIGTYATGIFDEGAAEIAAYDPETQRLFVINGGTASLDVIDIRLPSLPRLAFSIDLTPYGGGGTSVDVYKGLVAVAVPAADETRPGSVVFFGPYGRFRGSVQVGALPDMLTFTPDGSRVLVANEGQPNDDYTVDPEGSVSIIDLTKGRGKGIITQAMVTHATFTHFNDDELDPRIRIFGPGATVAQDLEPEYIAVSQDGRLAWVTLQQNNALGILDVNDASFRELIPLGVKDHDLPENALDASDEDGRIQILNRPVRGLYQPDAIAAYRSAGAIYLVTANEGDSRDYEGFSEEERVADLTLDPTAFPDAEALQQEAALGRLRVTSADGDTDGDGDFDELFAFGGRSFSIRDAAGRLVFDSGDDLERITAEELPAEFNSSNDENGSFDSRSDDKGPEPEGVVLGRLSDRTATSRGTPRLARPGTWDLRGCSSSHARRARPASRCSWWPTR